MGKETDQSLDLHQLILDGNDLALSQLYELYGEEIIQKLQAWYPAVANRDMGFIRSAINDAFWGYFRNPSTFSPDKNSLLRFLEMAAERDLINILEREKRYLSSKKAPNNVELEAIFWNSITQDHSSADGELIFDETMMQMNKILEHYFHTKEDIQLAKLVISQERETETFSLILQIQHWNSEEQQAEVKRHKDRIKKTLERHLVIEKLKRLIQ